MAVDDARRIAPVDDVPADSTLLVTLDDGGEEVEGILTEFADGVAAYLNYCQHWTDVRLDTGSGAPVRNDDILCRKHGATFGKQTGFCDFGPCEGATLDPIEVTVADGDVYLTDDAYEFVRVGPATTDTDLSTSPGERLGF